MGRLRIRATRFTKGLGRCWVEDSGDAVYHIAHMRCRARGNMENRLLGVLVALRIRGIATRALAAYADICPALSYGVVRLGKERLGCRSWQKVGYSRPRC